MRFIIISLIKLVVLGQFIFVGKYPLKVGTHSWNYCKKMDRIRFISRGADSDHRVDFRSGASGLGLVSTLILYNFKFILK